MFSVLVHCVPDNDNYIYILLLFPPQAQIYQDDFQSEREDRQTAHSKLVEMEGQRLSLQNELSEKTSQVEVIRADNNLVAIES